MSQSPLSLDEAATAQLAMYREKVAGSLSILLVVTFNVSVLTILGVLCFGRIPQAFEKMKDILLFLNPIIGYVLGYYFNKVTTEARAEKAEAVVKSTSAVAQQATASAQEAHKEAQVTRSALLDLTQSAEAVLTESGTDGTRAFNPAEVDLRTSLSRAKRLFQSH